MGYYINPSDSSKEMWLEKNAKPARFAQLTNFDYQNGEDIPIILVDNGMFSAAGIVYCKEEALAFIDADDPRPKKLFLAPKNKVIELIQMEPWKEEK